MKNELRKHFKIKRKNLINKSELDKKICYNVLSSKHYKFAQKVFCYVALNDEINTNDIIINALECGKKVALPVCDDSDGNMTFYYITTFDDLILGTFGVREPNVEKCDKALDFDSAVCIVPAMAFDKNGYRLGYGKGYYDRFLEKFTSISIGLCYNSFVRHKLPIDKHDKAVDYLITETGYFDRV